MTKMKTECVSRRGVFYLAGMTLASCVAIPAAAMLTATEAEARVGNPASAVSVAGVNRRDRRQDRRYKKAPATPGTTTSPAAKP